MTDFVFDPPDSAAVARADTITVDVIPDSTHVDHVVCVGRFSGTSTVELVAQRGIGGSLPSEVVSPCRFTFTSDTIPGGFRYTIADPAGWRDNFFLAVHTVNDAGVREVGSASYTPSAPLDRISIADPVPASGSTVAPEDTVAIETTCVDGAIANWYLFVGYQDPSELIGVESFELAAIAGFGLFAMPGYSVVEESIPGGFRAVLSRDGGWKRPFSVALAASDNGIPDLGYAANNAFPLWTYDVNPIEEHTDHDAPETSIVSPTPGTELAAGTQIVFDVTDDSGTFRRVLVAVYFAGTGITELVHDGEVFLGRFAACLRQAIANGFRYTIVPNTGWTSAPTLRIFAIDRTGKEV